MFSEIFTVNRLPHVEINAGHIRSTYTAQRLEHGFPAVEGQVLAKAALPEGH